METIIGIMGGGEKALEKIGKMLMKFDKENLFIANSYKQAISEIKSILKI